MTEDRGISAILEESANTPLPASGIDIDRAMSDGRRRLRQRRAWVGSAAALAVLVTIGGTTWSARGGLGPDSRPAAAPSVATSEAAPVPMPTRAPTEFDPLVRYATFGWLPSGFDGRNTTTGLHSLTVWAEISPSPADKDTSAIQLSVVTAGYEITAEGPDFARPQGQSGGSPKLTGEETVNGRRAGWAEVNGRGFDAALRWEYAPGAWAEVKVRDRGNDPKADDPKADNQKADNSKADNSKALARRVAANIRFEVNERIPLPMASTSLPATLRPIAVAVSQHATDERTWSANARYSDTGKRNRYGDWPLSITVMPRASETGDDSAIGNPTTTLDGRPARRASMVGGGEGLQVYNVQGLYVEIIAHPEALRLLPNGTTGVYRGLKLSPEPGTWK